MYVGLISKPAIQPTTAIIISMKTRKLKFVGCLEGVLREYVRLEGDWKVSGRYLKDVWRLLGECLEGVLKVFGKCI